MKMEDNKIEVSNGEFSRWVTAEQLSGYEAKGFKVVTQLVSKTSHSPKKSKEKIEATAEVISDTTQTNNGE